MTSFFVLTLGLLTLLAVSLQRTYAETPLKELKRQARAGNRLAEALVVAVGYGHSLRAVLWFLVGVCGAGFFVVVADNAPLWFALCASAVLVWLGFVWIPARRATRVGVRLAAWLAPLLSKLLFYLHPLIDWIFRFIRRHRPMTLHTGLYDRLDLVDLLERQQVQPDNRIEASELEIAKHALTFGDETIGERMVPRRAVKLVSAEDTLGPILLDELHKSGHSRFPVYEGKKDNIVGTLYLHDLLRAKHGGSIRKLMRPKAYYLHEEQSLHDALQAVLKTHQHLFIVVNSFEEFAGVISSEDVLEAILGQPIIDEFDQYEDLRAVAARSARIEHAEHPPTIAPEEPSTVESTAV